MNTEEMVRYKDQFWSKLNEKEQETYLLFGLSALSRKRRTESLEILRSLNREKKAKIKETENDHEMNESDQMEMDGMKQIDEMKQIDKIDKMEMDEMEEIEIKDSKKHNNNNNNNNNNNKNNNYKPCKPRFRAHFECMDEALKLNVNDTVDYRFENGRVILCKILDKTMDDINKHYIILLHPLGESLTVTKHNRYCDLFTEYHLLAPPKSISLRKLINKKHIFYDIQIDDYLDINPIYKSGHNGWKLGRVIKTDPNSGQIKAVYYNRNDQSNYSYWIHLENINEAAPFKTKCIDKTDNNENKTDVLQSPTGSISNIDCWHNVNIDIIATENNMHNASHSNLSTTQQTPPPIHGITKKYSTDWIHNSMDSIISNNSCNNHLINNYQIIKSSKHSTDWIQSSMDSIISNSSHHSHDNYHMMNGHNLNGKKVASKHATSSYSNLHGNTNSNQSDTDDPIINNINNINIKRLQSKTDEIMHQLYTFGYNDNDIKQAMDNVSNHHDINEILEYITNNNDISDHDEDEDDDDAKNDHLSDDELSDHETPMGPSQNDKNGVFGVQSILLTSTLIPDKDYGAPIPNILIKLKKELFQNNGQYLEGIFRINPNNAKCKQIEDEINNNCNNIENTDFTEINGALIANLIQIWFKKLPQKIFYDLDYNKIIQCKAINNAGIIIENDIGEPYESYFKWLLDLCIDITKHEKVNKMSIKNMAIVIAPNLYNLHKIKNQIKAMSVSTAMVKFVQLSILWRHFAK